LFFSRIWWREVLKVVVERGFFKSQCQNVERCVRVCVIESIFHLCVSMSISWLASKHNPP
jgi:hypothetical protein